ncbi:MAG: histidine kinase [Actinomycetota bacterium]|nr:histidine kinase [Actinomycetota bacterium]
MVEGGFGGLLRRERAFPELPNERYIDRFFSLLFWGYFAASYLSYLLEGGEGRRQVGILAGSAVFVCLAVAWRLLPWNLRVPRLRLLAAPAFLLASFLIVYLTDFGLSVGLYSIAVANSVFLFGLRRTFVFAAALLALIFGDYLLTSPGLPVGEALERAAYWIPFFAFVVGICAVAQKAVQRHKESRELLAKLEVANDELRRYAERVRELTISEERGRMARELHDAAGHHLAVVNLQLEAATRLLERDPEGVGGALERARTAAADAMGEVRRSVRALKPLAMEDRTGTGALAALAREFGGTGAPAVSFTVSGTEEELPPEAELVLYRALQEGLTNAAKYSGAGRVDAELAFAPGSVKLTVADDGRGAAGTGASGGGGFGIPGLRERAAALCGTVSVRNGDGGGYVLELELPVDGA